MSTKMTQFENIMKKTKQEQEAEQEFEQFQDDLFAQNPKIVSGYSRKFEPFSNIFPKEITDLMITYMRESEILQLGAIAPPILFVCRSEIYELMRFRRLVSGKLLPHVLSANPDGVDEFLRTSNIHPKILLIQSRYNEGVYTKKFEIFDCFRSWKAVSALKGAYSCGDGPFLGRRILAYLLRDNDLSRNEIENLLCEARQQLGELLNSIGVNDTKSLNSAVTTAKNVSIDIAITATASASIEVSTKDTIGDKEKTEFHHVSTNIDIEFADSTEFLLAIKNLIEAYKAYISRYDSFDEKNKETDINRLWRQICKYQKEIYQYVRQEFCSPIPFNPMPKFITSPPRGKCRYLNCEHGDFPYSDELGFEYRWGLYKGGRGGAYVCCIGNTGWLVDAIRLDLAAMSQLYKLRVEDLRYTFAQLHSLESALILINEIKPTLRI